MDNIYRVTTPEQVSIEYRIAGIGSRAIALLLDYVCIIVTVILLAISLFTLLGHMTSRLNAMLGSYVGALYSVAIFFFVFLYFSVFEAFWAGRTPGKWLLKLRVISVNGQSITFFSAFLRNLVRILDFLPFGYIVGLVFAMLTKREQRLGDLAAGTIVVMDRKLVEPARSSKIPAPLSALPDSASDTDENTLLLAKLCQPADKQLATAFLLRQKRLRAKRLDELATQVRGTILDHLPAGYDELKVWALNLSPIHVLQQLGKAWEEELRK